MTRLVQRKRQLIQPFPSPTLAWLPQALPSQSPQSTTSTLPTTTSTLLRRFPKPSILSLHQPSPKPSHLSTNKSSSPREYLSTNEALDPSLHQRSPWPLDSLSISTKPSVHRSPQICGRECYLCLWQISHCCSWKEFQWC